MTRNVFLFLLLIIAVAGTRGLIAFGGLREPSVPGAIVCFGDSITAGYRLESTQSYPYQLSLLLGEAVLNQGISGETTAQALQRLKRDVLSKSPRLVIVQFGSNDPAYQISPERTIANNDLIIEQIIDAGAVPVLLIGVSRMLDLPYLDGFRRIARRRGIVLIDDAIDPIIEDPAMTMDGIHPTVEGYKIMAERVASAIKHLL